MYAGSFSTPDRIHTYSSSATILRAYMWNTVRLIRNLDPEAYRALKDRAAHSGRTVGGLVSEAIRTYLAAPDPFAKRGSLRDLVAEDAGPGSEHLSDEIGAVVYLTP